MIRGLLITVKRVLTGDMTVKQAYVFSKMRLFNSQKSLNDDFDWTQYHDHYREELKVVGRTSTLLPRAGQFQFRGNTLVQLDTKAKPLHPNHHLLYEIVLGLRPGSALEIGCGGGDHLRNLNFFDSSIELFGVDRSERQLETLRERHPGLSARLQVLDITLPETVLPAADVVYSQTVLMHISESQGRFPMALNHMLAAARLHVVMVEDWTEHDFMAHVKTAMGKNAAWKNAKLYVASRAANNKVNALVLSKTALDYPELSHYDELLQGRKLQIH